MARVHGGMGGARGASPRLVRRRRGRFEPYRRGTRVSVDEHGARHLIVNADDFGRSHGINRGVFVAHDQGIVTSASLMVRWPAATDAVNYARGAPGLSLGLHIDLAEWVHTPSGWRPVYEVVDNQDA